VGSVDQFYVLLSVKNPRKIWYQMWIHTVQRNNYRSAFVLLYKHSTMADSMEQARKDAEDLKAKIKENIDAKGDTTCMLLLDHPFFPSF
jgi:hypothetical protein